MCCSKPSRAQYSEALFGQTPHRYILSKFKRFYSFSFFFFFPFSVFASFTDGGQEIKFFGIYSKLLLRWRREFRTSLTLRYLPCSRVQGLTRHSSTSLRRKSTHALNASIVSRASLEKRYDTWWNVRLSARFVASFPFRFVAITPQGKYTTVV